MVHLSCNSAIDLLSSGTFDFRPEDMEKDQIKRALSHAALLVLDNLAHISSKLLRTQTHGLKRSFWWFLTYHQSLATPSLQFLTIQCAEKKVEYKKIITEYELRL